MYKKLYNTLSCAALISILASCSNDAPETPVKPDPIVLPEVVFQAGDAITLNAAEKNLRNAGNAFALSLFDNVATTENLKENFCISPYSLFTTLSMLATGDNSKSSEQILDVINPEKTITSIKELNEFNYKMAKALVSIDPDVTFTSANSVWVNKTLAPLDSYKDALNAYYSAPIESVELSSVETKDKINNWCAEATKGLIDPFLTTTLDGSMAVLNAMYFKGCWEFPFKPAKTQKAMFSNLSGEKSEVDMMATSFGTVKYYNAGGLTAFALPYGNEAFEMLIIIPDNPASFSTIGQSILTNMTDLNNSKDYKGINLRMPKFKSDNTVSVIDALTSMGVTAPQTVGFDSMTKHIKPVLDKIIQRTTFSTDETGSEGASVTMAGLDTSAGPAIDPIDICLDRPFAYLVRETSSGLILFMGAVTKL